MKKEGILIYSTCSYSKEENEDILDWLTDTFDLHSVQIPISEDWGIIETESDKNKCYGYRFYPDKVKGEGFFISCLKKNDGRYNGENFRQKVAKINKDDENSIRSWISSESSISVLPVRNGYSVILEQHQDNLQFLQSKLYIKKSGVHAGKIAGKDLIPDHELALSLITNNQIPRINLSISEALSYLRRDEIKISSDIKGWALMCYDNFALGWAKILPNRVNNYYPKELRILKEFNYQY